MTDLVQKIGFLQAIDLPGDVIAPDGAALLSGLLARGARQASMTSINLSGAKIRLIGADGQPLLDDSLDHIVEAGPGATAKASRAGAPATGDEVDSNPIEQAQVDAQSVFDRTKNQVQISGSAVMNYQAGVDAVVREAISDSLLLAKLYADAQFSDFEAQPDRWFKAYLSILDNAGWAVTALLSGKYAASGKAAQVHEAIIALLTSVIGTPATGLALAKSVLDALSKVGDGPWITLWKDQTLRSQMSQFQFGVASNDEHGLSVGLALMQVKAQTKLKQLLFFKWNSADAALLGLSQKVLITRETLLETAPIVRGKLLAARKRFLSSIAEFKV